MNLPNKLTMLRILLIPVFMVFIEWDSLPGHILWAFVIFVAASLTDFVDGYIARKNNMVTDFGKFMDPLADKILVTAALVYFIPLGLAPAWVVILILAREFLVTSLRRTNGANIRQRPPWSGFAMRCWHRTFTRRCRWTQAASLPLSIWC